MDLLHPVILCGGGGTRLWPRSRRNKPKPFLPLLGDRTLFQLSCDRVGGDQFADAMVVAGEAHRDYVADQGGCLAEIIVEPAAKNTAPAIALAAYRLPRDAVMLVCPSDHHIGDLDSFLAGVRDAATLASEGWLVSFAITPDRPETGFGYLKGGEPLSVGQRIARFVEKPDENRARRLLEEGGYAWNAGIFAFQAGVFLDELMRHRPEMAEAVQRSVAAGSSDGQAFRPEADAFATIEGESLDYAVMENTDRAAMIAADMKWSDVGNWQALQDIRDSDDDGNSARGEAELVDCRNVMVDTDGPRVSVIGLQDIAIVVDGNEVLVTTRDGAQSVGKLQGAKNQ